MKIYLASRYSRRLELCGYRSELEKLGHRVTSRWLDGNHQISDTGWPIDDNGKNVVESSLAAGEKATAMVERFCREDIDDVVKSQLLIHFTEEPRKFATRGGRWVEMGIAIALRKAVCVIGPNENIFCYHQAVACFMDWETFIQCAPPGVFSKLPTRA